jgi:hypothetical protein
LRTHLLLFAVVAAAGPACFSPSFDSCAVTCGAGGSCPEGMTCLGDGVCHRSAGDALCAARPDADPDQPDADPNQPDADPDQPDAGPPVTPDTAGQLVITELMIDSSMETDQEHEWVEIYNPSDSVTYDLQGLWLYDLGSPVFDVIEIDAPVLVRPGAYVILAETDDQGVNGGVEVDFDWELDVDFNLTNGDDEVYLYNPDVDVDIDGVEYLTSWFATGAALSLDPDSLNSVDNDSMASWCDASTAFGTDGDLGTPGAANPDC